MPSLHALSFFPLRYRGDGTCASGKQGAFLSMSVQRASSYIKADRAGNPSRKTVFSKRYAARDQYACNEGKRHERTELSRAATRAIRGGRN